jgi:hypothetical protein
MAIVDFPLTDITRVLHRACGVGLSVGNDIEVKEVSCVFTWLQRTSSIAA